MAGQTRRPAHYPPAKDYVNEEKTLLPDEGPDGGASEDAKALLARIVAEPGKMGGKPVIRGRRITPGMVLALLARGATRADVLDAYPALEPADIDACLLYGARLAERADADGLAVAAE